MIETPLQQATWEVSREILELVGADSRELDRHEFGYIFETAHVLLTRRPGKIEEKAATWRERRK